MQEQNLAEFQSLLDKTLAVDLERAPQSRMVNVLAQRRAQWLRARVAELFLDAEPTGGTP